MVLIKVQYDAYNRQFKLLDREAARKLEDGETYVLIADIAVADAKLPSIEDGETLAAEVEQVLA
jgi:hypothetical protein